MKRSPFTQFSVAALCGFSLVASALAAAEEIALAKCPAPVQKVLGEAGTVRTVVKFLWKDGLFLYEADVKSGSGAQIDIVVTAEGKVTKKSESVKLAACPEEVRKTFQQMAVGKKLGRVYLATNEDGNSYHTEITSKENLLTQLTVGTNGKVIMVDEETTPDATPEAVKNTILGKLAGGMLENVYKITNAEGKVAYNARIITAAKVAMDLSMDANGKVMEFTKAPE